MSKTEVATRESQELAQQAELEAELAAKNTSEIDSDDIQIPLLKVGQPLTEEVANGDAAAGDFINALTGESLGTEVEFVVAGYSKGRFFHGDRKSGRRARKAYRVTNVPWKDDPHFGEPFAEHPDAEERYSERANAGEIEWGKGPPISTTYDFTGHVVSGLEEGEEPIPVCLSLMRTNSKAAKKWATLLQAVLNGKFWAAVFTVSTDRAQSDKGNFYVVNVKQSRATTQEEKLRAVQLAQVLRNQNVVVRGEDDSGSPTAAPDEAGGLAV